MIRIDVIRPFEKHRSQILDKSSRQKENCRQQINQWEKAPTRNRDPDLLHKMQYLKAEDCDPWRRQKNSGKLSESKDAVPTSPNRCPKTDPQGCSVSASITAGMYLQKSSSLQSERECYVHEICSADCKNIRTVRDKTISVKKRRWKVSLLCIKSEEAKWSTHAKLLSEILGE